MNLKTKNIKNAFKAAFPYTIPILTGFLVLGIAYGILMQSKGYGVLWSTLMSTVCYCGSMQFVAITILTTAFNPIQAFLLSVMVNARHLFYSLSMLEKYKGMGKAKFFLIYTLCDETFSISNSISVPDNVDKKYFYLFISLLNYIYWVIGSFIGGLFGSFIKFNTKGLDFALTALFVVLFIEQIKSKENKISGLIGIVCSVVCLVIFGKTNMVYTSMALILVLLLIVRKTKCN